MGLRQRSILTLVVHTIVSDVITLLNSYYISNDRYETFVRRSSPGRCEILGQLYVLR
jgi:hypothetical protein